MANCPTPDADFDGWLKHQKSNWRGIRKAIKSEKRLIPRSSAIQGKLGGMGGGIQSEALANFMRNMDDTVLNSNWHIIKIEET
jgi:hypothetical protein